MRAILLLTLLLVVSTMQVSALRNPSAVYCEAMGYEYVIYSTPMGDVGKCLLPDGEAVDAWDFYTGKVSLEYSYCAKQGYEAKHIETESCPDCLVCVLPNGTEIEVAELMDLQLEETTCGDNICGIPENHSSCPQDCSSGSEDGYCDAVKDGVCDPDCIGGEDEDCKLARDVASTTTETPVAEVKGTPGFELLLAAISLAALAARRKYR